ncbi:MAG: ISNCY family transposase [Gemmatimonadaceae bacterium]
MTVLRGVAAGLMAPCVGARKLGLSPRQFRRLRRSFERKGDAAVIHGLRDNPSNRRLDEKFAGRVLARAAEPVFHDFGPTLLAEHLSKDPAIGPISAATLRNWMIAKGLWSVKERRLRHRSRRQRKAAAGELVQMDTSIHAWFEGRSSQEPVLIAMIDDATSKLFARFHSSDSGYANRSVLRLYIKRFGRMESLYVDHATHFQYQTSKREMAEQPPMSSQIKRALDTLDIKLISALSPQAKGRVERLSKTLQDRLLKEMRIAGISSIERANQYLEEIFIPLWNNRFAVQPQIATDFHRPVPHNVDLMEIFGETHTRLIRSDFTIRYENVYYQLPKDLATASMPGNKLTVVRRLDGKLVFRWKVQILDLIPLNGLPATAPKNKLPRHQPESRSPALNHPWRKTNMIFAVKD